MGALFGKKPSTTAADQFNAISQANQATAAKNEAARTQALLASSASAANNISTTDLESERQKLLSGTSKATGGFFGKPGTFLGNASGSSGTFLGG